MLQHLVPIEREIQSHSGRWYLRRTLPYRTSENHIEGVVITFVDIGARKRSEMEVLKSHERVQGVLEQMPTAVVILDPLGRPLVVCEPQGRQPVRHQPADTRPARHRRAVPAIAERHAQWRTSLSGRGMAAGTHADHRRRPSSTKRSKSSASDKVIRVFSVSSAPVRNADGAIIAVVGTFLDITQRRRSEEALAEAKQRLRLLVESAMDFAILTLDVEGPGDSAGTTGAERMLGWTEKESLGSTAQRDIHARGSRVAQVPQAEIRQALETGRATDERWHLRKDGSRFWASGVMTRMSAPHGDRDAVS